MDGEIHHLIRELQRIVVRLEAAAVRQRQSAPGNGVAARVRACVTHQSAAEGGGLAVHRTGGDVGQRGVIRAVDLALTGIRRHRDDSRGNGGHRRSLLAAGRQPIVACGRAAQRQAGDTDGPVRAHVLAVEGTISGNGKFIAFRLAADDRPADIQHGVSAAVVGLIRRRDAADSDGPGRDGEALRHRAERIVAHGRDGHGAARADISVLAIGDGVIPPLGQLGAADLYGGRRRDPPAGIGGVAAQRHRRRGLIGRDGERPAVVRQVCGGIVVLALRHVDPDVVRAHIGGLLHLDAVPIVLHRDAAHARNTGPGRHRRRSGAAVIGQRIGRGEGEVPCLRDSLPDGIGHAGGLAAHGDAGGVGARINGRCGQGAAVLLIGDLAHVRRRPPGLGQPGRLGAAVIDQSAAGRRDGDAAAVGIAAEPVRIPAFGADGRAVAAQRIAPVVLMAPQHHGLALVDAADGVLAGGPADKAALLDPVGIFRGGDGHGAAGFRRSRGLDGDAGSVVQLAHHGDGPARAEEHILGGIDRAAQIQRAVVVHAELAAGGGERAVDRDRTVVAVIQAVGLLAAGISGGGQCTVDRQRTAVIIHTVVSLAGGRQRTGDCRRTSVAQAVAVAGADERTVDGYGTAPRVLDPIGHAYVAAIRRQRAVNSQRTQVVHTVTSAVDGIAGGLDRTGDVHRTGVVDGGPGAGNGAVIQVDGIAGVVLDTHAGAGKGNAEDIGDAVPGDAGARRFQRRTAGVGVSDGAAGPAVGQDDMSIGIDPHRRRPAAGDLVPVQAEDGAVLRRPWVCTQIHVACQVVVTRLLGQGIRRLVCGAAAVLLLHQLICPRHELAVHVLGVIADAFGVLPLVAAGAVGVVADQVQEDVVVIVEGQVIGAVIIGEEAYQRCRAALDHSDGRRRIGETALLFRRDADAGAFVQLAVQRDGLSGRQIDVGAAARDRRGAAHGQRAVVIHTASAAVVGDEASVEAAHTGVIHAAAPGAGTVVADGAAVHIECTVVVYRRAIGRAGGAPQPSVVHVERTAVVHGVDRSAAGAIDVPLDRGALRQREGHAAVNGNGVKVGLIESKLPDSPAVQAEHRAVRGTPCVAVRQRHAGRQIVIARILGQGVGRGMAAVAVLAGRLVVRPRGVGHVAVLRMAAGCGVAAADAVDVGIQADIAAAGLPDLGMAPVQHGGRVAVVTGVAVLPPVVPGRAAVQEIRDLAAAELILRLAAVAVVAVRAVVAVGDHAAVLIGDGAPADDVAYRAVGLGLHHVSVEIAVGDGTRVLIGDAACPAAVVHLDAAAAVQPARVHAAGLDGAVIGIDQTAQAVLGRYTAAVPAVGDGTVVDARQGSAGDDGIILALALRHGEIRQLRARADIAE